METTMIPEPSLNIIKIAVAGFSAFVLALLFTPGLIRIMYKYRLWRKDVRTKALGGGEVPFFQKFHGEGETGIPRFGGVLIWIVPPVLALIFWLLSFTGIGFLEKLNFLSRAQTWLPLPTLLAASAVGFLDDMLQVVLKPSKDFFGKLEFTTLLIPGVGNFDIGIWYLPLFVLVMLATYSGGVIDGLDGLAGGTFAAIFTS